jgi:DNA-binding transcriptional LysR family regulator
METRILHYFLAVARLGTVSAAARELHVAQPTLSRQIQQLEEQLGAPLFKRERRRMTLTKAGLAYQIRVQQILTELERANQVVAGINNHSLTGKVGIGCVQSAVHHFIIPLLADFQQRYPAVQLDFYDADGEEIKERMDQGLLELGIVSTPISTVKYHSRRLPADDRWGIAVPQTSYLRDRQFIQPEDLKGLPLIVPHRSLIKNELNNWLQPTDTPLKVIGESNLINNAAYMAANSNAGLICIEGAPRPADSHLTFIPFKPAHTQKHFLIWRKGVSLSEAAHRLINQINAQLSPQ